jgi:DNA mismatch repair protein MutL
VRQLLLDRRVVGDHEHLPEPAAQPLEGEPLREAISIALPAALGPLLQAQSAALEAYGFRLTAGADEVLRVTTVPAGLWADAVGPVLEELGMQLRAAGGTPPADWREQVLTTIACHSAIRTGQRLSPAEMGEVLTDLAHCALPRSCPHGQPTVLVLPQRQLEQHFRRNG